MKSPLWTTLRVLSVFYLILVLYWKVFLSHNFFMHLSFRSFFQRRCVSISLFLVYFLFLFANCSCFHIVFLIVLKLTMDSCFRHLKKFFFKTYLVNQNSLILIRITLHVSYYYIKLLSKRDKSPYKKHYESLKEC